MIQTIKYLRIPESNPVKCFIVLLLIGLAIAQLGNYVIDHHSFPGCTIVGTEDSGRTLVIELDEEYASGSDGACEAAGQLIYEICMKGYKVRVTNWTLTHTISLSEAFWLARGY